METTANPIATLLEDARKRLVETGTRNRLIHVNRKNKRANILNIINERSDDIYNILWKQEKTMSFLPILKEKEDEIEDSDTPLLEAIHGDSQFDPARYTDRFLETRMTADKLQKNLLRLYRDAKTAEGEQGINILYLALGFLRWFEDENSKVQREAPLILLPVELKRNLKTSTYDIIARQEDIGENISLRERLESDFGIKLPELSDTPEFTPSSYFQEIEKVIASKTDWSIDHDGMQLGFFSFAKLLMLLDLDPQNWTGQTLENHPLVSGLLQTGFETETPLFADNEQLDHKFDPIDIIQVVDADASQTKVIEEVRTGRNLVVQGPPGTGKSQTITNIIAAAAHDGKKVLFVAEKMAALEVVHERLVKVGLRDICIELHSRNANKKSVIGELARTLNASYAISNIPPPPDRLKKLRDQLNSISQILHSKLGNSLETPFTLIGIQAKFQGAGIAPPTINLGKTAHLSRDEAAKLETIIERFIQARNKIGSEKSHPFRGVQACSLQPTDLDRFEGRISPVAENIQELADSVKKISHHIGNDKEITIHEAKQISNFLKIISEVPSVDDEILTTAFTLNSSSRLVEALELGKEWQFERKENDQTYNQTAWNTQLNDCRTALLNGQDSFLAKFGRKYKNASTLLAGCLSIPLPKAAEARIKLLDDIQRIQNLRKELTDEETYLKSVLGTNWRGEKTAFADILKANSWVEKLNNSEIPYSEKNALKLSASPEKIQNTAQSIDTRLSKVAKGVEVIFHDLSIDHLSAFEAKTINEIPLDLLADYFSKIAQGKNRYHEWVEFSRLRSTLVKNNLSEVVSSVEAGTFLAENAVTEFRYARAEALWKAALEAIPSLQKLSGINRQDIVEAFQEEERTRFTDTVTQIKAKHLDNLPQGAAGDMAIIRGEIAKKVRHKPIRQLMSIAGQAIQRIKPVFLMSPISVAQFLPPGKFEFDLLVIDEASQVRPEDALGSIARARQIVVVGDQKQLPPSSFFDRLTANEAQEGDDDILRGAARATELESILSLCEARGFSRSMLEWHYRSRDPSLIAVSNAEFYEHNLILPPTPLQNDSRYGLSFTRVAGVYDRGGKRVNRIEAEAIVLRTLEHAKKTPELSLGIVTFSTAQSNMVTELLEHERRKDKTLDSFLREGKNEDIFVKNIENVQGDERDVILVSVGYGPTEPNGRLASMSFGPVNSDGGERRLNVLFTRSRLRCEVFASFDPGDIDLNRTSKNGPRVLKRFLEFAKTGILDERTPTGGNPDSPFEEDVAREIRNLGFEADYQVGSAGFLIDLGVRHSSMPGKYILAVECDGATYHSALWARERDRLRQGVLEHLGWQFHRIWSTDWFYRRAEEIERLRNALEKARAYTNSDIGAAGANVESMLDTGDDDYQTEDEFIVPMTVKREFPAYERYTNTVSSELEPHEVPIVKLASLVERIVKVEGPVQQDEIARRLATCFGKERTGRRILEATYQALQLASNSENQDILNEGLFWMTSEQQKATPIRDRSAESGTLLKAENLAPIEIRAALAVAASDNVGAASAELIRAAAAMMGFKRVGPDLQAVFEKAI